MYQRSEFGFGVAGSVAALSRDQILADRSAAPDRWADLRERLAIVDFVPDLGLDIGSLTWFRGAATCVALCAIAVALVPPAPVIASSEAPALDRASWEERRALSIAPLGLGGDSGKRMAAGDAVVPISGTPERPVIELAATLGQGDSFGRVLERAGVGRADAARVADLVSRVTPLSAIEPGTSFKLTLGRRANARQVRPLDALSFRARFDMGVSITRTGTGLSLTEMPVAVDNAPIRIQGRVGESLYRSARAAGVPSNVAEAYIRAIATKVSLGNDVDAGSRFDLVVEHQRAETGEVRFGKLLYAGIDTGSRRTQLMQWTINGRTDWLDPKGMVQSQQRSGAPVANARMSSGFGMRFHPILGYGRMHQGVDYAAPHGSPIYAVSDGVVSMAGWHGGHGRYVRISHSSNLGTGYSHMSRIAVSPGSRVRQGDVIGYVGSTGLSTGPHLHFEVYKNGAAINPRRFVVATPSVLEGQQLVAFRERLKWLTSLPVKS